MTSLTLRRDAEQHSAIPLVYQSPRTFHSPYRAALHSDLALAADARRTARKADAYQRRTMLDLARRAITRASRKQQPSAYWQPIP